MKQVLAPILALGLLACEARKQGAREPGIRAAGRIAGALEALKGDPAP